MLQNWRRLSILSTQKSLDLSSMEDGPIEVGILSGTLIRQTSLSQVLSETLSRQVNLDQVPQQPHLHQASASELSPGS